jgi:uncharacterized protein
MKYVLQYQAADDVREKAPAHFQAHCAHWDRYRKEGTLLMVGPFADPDRGAMGIFTTREAAHEFAEEDPFVVNGVVKSWTILEWNEALT